MTCLSGVETDIIVIIHPFIGNVCDDVIHDSLEGAWDTRYFLRNSESSKKALYIHNAVTAIYA